MDFAFHRFCVHPAGLLHGGGSNSHYAERGCVRSISRSNFATAMRVEVSNALLRSDVLRRGITLKADAERRERRRQQGAIRAARSLFSFAF